VRVDECFKARTVEQLEIVSLTYSSAVGLKLAAFSESSKGSMLGLKVLSPGERLITGMSDATFFEDNVKTVNYSVLGYKTHDCFVLFIGAFCLIRFCICVIIKIAGS
jgi:hypothetical protein